MKNSDKLLLHILFKTLKEKYERQTNEMKGNKNFTKKPTIII